MTTDRQIEQSQIKFWYGTPLWAVRIMLIVSIILSGLFFTMAYSYDSWATNNPAFIKYFIYVLSISFLAAGVRPRNWQQWTYFAATKEGLVFPSDVPLRKHSTWLLVPWDRVGEIKITRFLGGTRGPSIEILIGPEEKQRYFPEKRIMENVFGNPASNKRYTVVGYSTGFINKEHAVKLLNEIKQTYNVPERRIHEWICLCKKM